MADDDFFDDPAVLAELAAMEQRALQARQARRGGPPATPAAPNPTSSRNPPGPTGAGGHWGQNQPPRYAHGDQRQHHEPMNTGNSSHQAPNWGHGPGPAGAPAHAQQGPNPWQGQQRPVEGGSAGPSHHTSLGAGPGPSGGGTAFEQAPQHPLLQSLARKQKQQRQGDRPQLSFQQSGPRQGGSQGHRQRLDNGGAPGSGCPPQRPTERMPPPQPRGPKVTVSMVFLPQARIGFRFGYNEALAAAVKRVEGREFDSLRKVWTVPMEKQEETIKCLTSCPQANVEIEPLAPATASILQAAGKNVSDDQHLYGHIPEGMERQMMAFQKEGVKFGLSKGGRVLLGDEMGLGKTVQAIALMACYQDDWPCLIITPSSLREQWADALHRWLGITDRHVHLVYDKKDTNILKRRFQFLIISYDYVTKMRADLEKKAFQVIVCDESHYIKNHKAARSKDTVPLLKKARRCILCSGTPALSRPVEILQQLVALLPTAKITVNQFADRFCQGSRFSKLQGASNLDELHALCTMAFLKRRLKKDVLDQLPPKMRQQIYMQLGDKEMGPVKQVQKQLENVKQTMKQAEASGSDATGGKLEEKRLLNELYQVSAQAKVKAVQQYVLELLEGDQKFLIFAHHRCLLDGVEQCLRGRKVKFIRIDGSTPSHERQGLVTAFQENESHKVAVLSLRAAGQGLTLTAAHLVVMAELSWTPGELVQAEDRVHRIGQADSVSVHYLHARNTVDDIIWQTIQNKLENIGQTLDGHQDKLEVASSGNAKPCGPEPGQSRLNNFVLQPNRDPNLRRQLDPKKQPVVKASAAGAKGLQNPQAKRPRVEQSSQGTTLFDIWGS